MPAIYKIIWCCPCLLHTGCWLTYFHRHMHLRSLHIKACLSPFFLRAYPPLFHISVLVTAWLSAGPVVYEVGWVGKGGIVVFEVARGRECQQTWAPPLFLAVNHQIIAGETRRTAPVLEVLVQLKPNWIKAAGEAHLHALQHLSCWLCSH